MNRHLQPFIHAAFASALSLGLCSAGVAQDSYAKVDPTISGEKLALEQGREAMAGTLPPIP